MGDRYRLDRSQRHILFRGVFSNDDAARRAEHRTDRATGRLFVDAYNVVLVVLNYRRGTPVFVCDDGYVRDVGGIHGGVKSQQLLRECFSEVVNVLAERRQWSAEPGELSVAFDAPVSHSGRHAQWCRELFQEAGVPAHVEIADSADFLLNRATEGAIATGDSVVIDRTALPVWDLAATVLQDRYGARLVDLRDI